MVEITVNSKDCRAARIVNLVLNGTAPHLLVFDGKECLKKKNRVFIMRLPGINVFL
jgi:hypothetical protein